MPLPAASKSVKVSILSITVGQGHNAASKALANYMRSEGHEVSILDTYKYLSPMIGLGVDKGYVFMGRFWPKLNETIYQDAEKHNGRRDMKASFPWAFADLTKTKMLKYLEDEKPDVVVCPIVMTAIIMTTLRDAGTINPDIKVIGIVTDYSLHPYWEYTTSDYFVAANELMMPSMIKRGIPREKILPTGIPVDPRFTRSISKKEARERCGLEQDKYTVLLSAGGMGFAGLVSAAEEIDKADNIQMVAICGTNAMLFNKINGMEFHNPMHVRGFVDNMDEYMDAADIIVTKPGGLSTSEAIAKRKTILLSDPMPGVEYVNDAFLVNNSLAVHATPHQPFSEVLDQLRMNPLKVEEMERAQARWGNAYSAKALGDFIADLPLRSDRKEVHQL